ncbi:coproporphyrinogen III oxidase [Actinobacteria bacterium YIM 96077]|uniref:Heme chaperone HemW n=1 Tax=Phytoactinopolyspora halophila TaxID=1981511 RepID=A0A329QI44_9ACTN|nr:radical SAM family heme chaperone HemW [Phytoactinopolyspora halophila]AYY14085.1 coproporphyrinogen III oxidase [Actinobacteria bacterium YIM 96077]RAW10992.1 coproporphyrinogen III oxidase [Phytoactinopolyspora halophila]
MPSTLPPGEPVPSDGALPASALAGVGSRPFGLYLHVPFCTTRCGYCDFNTYTAAELGDVPGASRSSWADAAISELRLARRVMHGPAWPGAGPVERADMPVATVFVGGGTPTLLPPADLGRVLKAIDAEFGLAPDAEITTEANPETLTPDVLAGLREAGFTRISIGMQSVRAHVLAVLDRVHTPGRAEQAAREARAAGFEHVSLDLIYGTPGESQDDWRASLEAAIGADPDHVSAYALIVEEGTRLAARIARGELPMPDDDDHADKYILAEDVLTAAGFSWYEVSNWARTPDARCAHNLLYWTGADWWGIGPGAHSHVGGTRWWNLKHPASWARRLAEGQSPAYAREILDARTREMERVLLEVRLAGGLDGAVLDDDGWAAAWRAVDGGLADADALSEGRLVLTLRGRLMADAVVRDLLG